MPVLRLTMFWCRDADPKSQQTPLILNAARDFARKQGLELEVLPQNVRDPTFVLDYTGLVISPRDHDDGIQAMVDRANQRVRGRAHTAFQANGRLPVVMGALANLQFGPLRGFTVMAHTTGRGTVVKSAWLPWCLVDPATARIDGQTLMHEIGHAAGAEHSNQQPSIAHAPIPPGDLMMDGGPAVLPVTMRPETLELFRKSGFCW